MAATVRAPFPAGVAAASSIAVTTVSTSVTVVAGDVLEAHVMLSAGTDTGITLAATYGGAAASGSTSLIHANSQNAGAEQVFYWLAPATGTANVQITASGGTPDALGLKVYALSGTDGNAPTVESAGTPNDTTNRTAATSTAVNLPTGSLGISHFVAGSNWSSTGQTNVLLANVGGTGAAISMAGATAAGAGSNVTFTATISAADWYAEIVTVWAQGGGSGGGTPAVTPGRRYYAPRKNPALEQRFGAFKPLLQGTPPVTLHADPPYFSDRIGGTANPVFIMSAEDWAVMFNGGTADGSGNYLTSYDNYFNTRAAQGYNGIEVTMFSQTNMAGAHNGPDGDGVYPWNTNSTDPSDTANTTFWARRDAFFSKALAKGFYVFCNAGTAMLDQGAFTASWTTTQWQTYGTFLGTRYPASSYPNIMWILGDDYFGTIDSNLTAFYTALRAAGGTQPMSYQAYQEASSRKDIYNGSTSLWGNTRADYNWGYSYNATYDVVEKMGLENDSMPAIPYMFGDGVFLNSGFTGITSDNYGRRMIWWALSSGSKSFNLGDNDVWTWDTGSQTTIATANFYTTVVPAIMSRWRSITGWHRLLADTSSQLVTGGRGTHISAIPSGGSGTAYTSNTDSYVTASRTPDGTLAVIYMSHASTITIDETKMVAGYTAKWVDPASGAMTSATPGPTYNSGSKGSNSAGDADWALVLQQPASTTPVSTTRATSWNVKATTTATRSTTWNTKASVTASRASTWRVLAGVTKTASTTWRVLAQTLATRSTTWRVLAKTTATRVTSWNVKTAVTATRATTWDTLAGLVATRATTWRTLATTTATRATTWNVASALTQVVKTVATTWRVLSKTTATRATSWNTKASVTATRSTTWRVLAAIAATRSTTWRVLARITATRTTLWNVASSLTNVVVTRSTTWRTLAKTTATRAASWNTKATVTSSRVTSWDTLRSVTPATRSTTWRVLKSATATRAASWRTLAKVVATRVASWGVHTDTSDFRNVEVRSVIETPREVRIIEQPRDSRTNQS